MEFCENFYKNLPNNIMTVLSDLTEKYTEEAGEERILFLNKFKTVSKLIYTILKGRKSPITPARENQAFLNEL